MKINLWYLFINIYYPLKPMNLINAIKPMLFIILSLGILSSCNTSPNTISSRSLNKADGIYKYKEKPFSGRVLDTTKSGRVELTFKCINGKIDGEYLEYYYGNGNLKEKNTYEKGKKTGPYKKFTENGEVLISGNFLGYKKNDEWLEYYSNGNQKQVGHYIDGMQTGEWKYFYDNGKLRAEGNYKNGDGSNFGTIGIPINGRFGIWKFYFEDSGKIESEREFKNGLLDGKFTQYYSNGQVKFKGTFKDHKENGIIEVYDEYGILNYNAMFENGVLIERKH
ncbi:toxin-antitoxin system YwqK family antitoxin [Sediminicola arcticus]|uniref:Toxin-antitoxin system YwqK family antitoxin n=1 Tax=Sediminicola arcticus TaxID=1574308 RepID=A0ABV2SSC5_9FLAO